MKTTISYFKIDARFLLMVFLLLGIGLFSLTGCKPQKIEAPPPTPTPTPVPALGNIVFIQGGHLVELNLSNSQITPLTSGKSTEWFPMSSSDGQQVVYWSNANSTIYNLWKINLLTSQRTQLTFNEADGLPPSDQNLLVNAFASWSRDGKTILYTQDGDIWAMNSDGYDPRTVLSGQDALCPSFSPDGKSIIYISKLNATTYNLYLFSLADQNITPITHYTDWNVGSPTYSSDGSRILFNLYRDDESQIYTIKPNGDDPLNLNNSLSSLSPAFGQNDQKIYFASYGSSDNPNINIYVMNANGTDVKPITTNGGESPSWVPSLIVVPTPTDSN